jgi:hypothetical protein
MNGLKSAAIVVVAFVVMAFDLTGPVFSAEEASPAAVTISSPVDGSKLAGSSAKINYDVTAAPKAEHVHVFVDGEEVARLHQLKGSYSVDKLSVGKHWLCVRVVDKGHTPVGAEKCVGVTVGNIPPMGY